MRNARLSFSSGEPLDVTCRASMNSLNRKATSIILINGVIMMVMTVMVMMMMVMMMMVVMMMMMSHAEQA